MNHPKEQMHRISYTKLTEQQILDKLDASSGPTSASALTDQLDNTSLHIVTDDGGPELIYRFSGVNRLTLVENGKAAMRTRFGALSLDDVLLISHLVPGTQRGYHVVVDRRTNLATVFEVWFSGFEDNREVQRQIHYGYVAIDGRPAPEGRHAITNRLEGKGYYWKQDNGIETLEYFPSVIYSNFVELTRFGGELSWCGPSDYVKIDDERYIYSRVEAEFSGIMTVYVLDVNRVEQVGARLGFNEADELEHYLFRGNGEQVGQLARFEPFGDYGEKIVMGDRTLPDRRGGRLVYRPLRTMPKMTKEEVDQAIARNTTAFAEAGAMAGNKLPASNFLAGKSLTLRYDGGPAIQYRFMDAHRLRWRHEGERMWHVERYESWESAPGVVMFGHLLSTEPNHDCHSVVADFHQGLVSCFHGTMGTPYFANEAAAETLFGVVEMEGLIPPRYRRHERTDELVGTALTWSYSPGLTSMHLYSTPHSLSWIIFLENGSGGMEWSGPADYVKVREGLYLVYWLEEACNGTLGTILVNMHTMHDCGVGYHAGPDGLSLSSVGAISRHAGKLDVAKYFSRKA